jgi:cytidylate kinase
VARRVAERLGYVYVDTGAMYRAIAWATNRDDINPSDAETIAALANRTRIQLVPSDIDAVDSSRVLVDGVDVTDEIRTPAISAVTSSIASFPAIRKRMASMQKAMGAAGGVVMEGRDIGTVVMPDAEVKIFLTASVEQRARRRAAELAARGTPVDMDILLGQIEVRDRRDASRSIAPMVAASDALVLDSDALTADEVVDIVVERCREAAARG